MYVIVVRNYGRKEHPTFNVEEIEDVRIVERNILRRNYEEAKKLNWAFNYDKVSHMEYLSKRLQRLEKESASLEEINAALEGMCCVSIPDGIDPTEYMKIVRSIYYTGYDRGYSDGRQ